MSAPDMVRNRVRGRRHARLNGAPGGAGRDPFVADGTPAANEPPGDFQATERREPADENETCRAAVRLVASGALMAQTKAPEPRLHPVRSTSALVTDYRYRGISQTALKPALQGGADFAHKGGFYIGTWASTSSGSRTPAATAPRSTSTVATRASRRLGSTSACCATTTRLQRPGEPEHHRGLRRRHLGPGTLKYSHTVTNLGSAPTARTAATSTCRPPSTSDGADLTPHIGYQRVEEQRPASPTPTGRWPWARTSATA